MAKILVIDDDVAFAEVLRIALVNEGYCVDLCHSGGDALQILDFSHFDLLILDWDLGDYAGPEICRNFRCRGGTSPVLMLTGRSDMDSKVEGLEKGCDDYLSKPVDHRELSVRVKVLLRRAPTVQSDVLEYQGLQIRPREGVVLFEEKILKIQPLEIRLLEHFVRHQGQWFKTEELIARIWPASSAATTDTVKVSVNRLRLALQPSGIANHLQSARGKGYRLE